MRGVVLGAGLAAALCGAAIAQVETRPDWEGQPSGEDLMRYYPDAAIDKSVSGTTLLKCQVNLYGRLKNCSVTEESPAGMGFGEAALAMADKEFRMKPGRIDGKPVDGQWVEIPLTFQSPTFSGRYVITEAIWTEAPTFEDMAAAWPADMGDLPVGTAVLRCQVKPGGAGRLNDCTIAGQLPKGSPFGEAARSLVGKFRLRLTPEEAKKYSASDIAISFRFYNPATAEGQRKKVEKPDWIVRIDPEKVVALYPIKAADAGVRKGVGVADCLVAPDGKLTDCKIARETPADMGFGPAAVLVAGVMQMDPWTPQGRPVAGARIKLPIEFSLAPEPEPAADAPAAP